MQNLYKIRAFFSELPEILKHPNVLKASKIVRESVKSRGGRKVPAMNAYCRVVLSAPIDNLPSDATCTLIGTTHDLSAPTFVPPERCKYGHAPLRYLVNGGCVECAKKLGKMPRRWLLRLQVPYGSDWRPLAASLGMEVVREMDRPAGGWQGIEVSLPLGMNRTDAAAIVAPLGWQAVLFWY